MSSSSQRIRDMYHDGLARALIPGESYTTIDNGVFYVIRVDHGSKPNEFPGGGRRPAQALVVFLSSPLGFREGARPWIQGMHLEGLNAERIT